VILSVLAGTAICKHPPPRYHHHRPRPHGYSHPPPTYAPAPTHKPHEYKDIPDCSINNTKPYCLEDEDYPEYEVKHAIAAHKHKFLELYADVADLNTDNSVDRLTTLEEETYICPSETAYIMPRRAINTSDKWRIIINHVKVDYDVFTQTIRVEDCLTAGESCPVVPPCYETTCLQKSIVHRMLVFDPYDHYFPFAIETFELPSACACHVGAYTFDH